MLNDCCSSLQQINNDVQNNPGKYSEKDFETINKMVKQMNYDLNPSIYDMLDVSKKGDITFSLFKLDNDKFIDKYKNLPVINYSSFNLVFTDIPTDKYDLGYDIVENIFQRGEVFSTIHCLDFKTLNIIKILRLSSKAYFLAFIDGEGWNDLTLYKQIPNICFPNLINIRLDGCKISEYELSLLI